MYKEISIDHLALTFPKLVAIYLCPKACFKDATGIFLCRETLRVYVWPSNMLS